MENTNKTENQMVNLEDFLKKYKMCKNNTQKSALLNGVEIKDYIPYSLKVAVAKDIVEKECVSDEGFHPNSDRRHLAFFLSVVMLYTNLDIDDSYDSTIYDELRACGLLDNILELANKNGDIKEYKLVWSMVYDDLCQEHNSLNAIIGQQVAKAAMICNIGLYKLGESIEHIDYEKVGKGLSTYAPVIQSVLKVLNK